MQKSGGGVTLVHISSNPLPVHDLSLMVGSAFAKFDTVRDPKITDPVIPGGAQRKKKDVQREFFSVIESSLQMLSDCRRNAPSWCEVFYARLVHTQELLEPSRLEDYINWLSYYLKKRGTSTQGLPPVAKDLLHWLKTHRMDPDCVLLGGKVAPNIVQRYDHFLCYCCCWCLFVNHLYQ